MTPRALADASPRPFWTDRPDWPEPAEPASGALTADLAVVGAGFTGLWAAVEALRRDPGRRVVVLDAGGPGFGASGRNGGFLAESLTHGLAHGVHLWPQEMPTLLRLGRENVAEIATLLRDEGADVDLRLVGKTLVGTRAHHWAELSAAAGLHARWGEDATLLDAQQVRADIAGPGFVGGLRVRSGGGLLDPGSLVLALRRIALRRGAVLHDHSPVVAMERDGAGVALRTPVGTVRAARAVVATNAFPPPLRRVRAWVIPVYDHVLVTEPLPPGTWRDLGWAERQGLTDLGNQFHYCRPTRDGRLLWGGYDAVYHRGGRVDPAFEQAGGSHALLARQLVETFPCLADVRFTHRWAGPIDTTTRFTPVFGTALRGRVSYACGYTGLGVGSSRFGARVALDLVDRRRTERTELRMVRLPPVPFPPEPLRNPLVQYTRRSLAAADERDGRRNLWLRTLDRFKVGFDS